MLLPVEGGSARTVTLDENGVYPPVELPAGEVAVAVDNRQLEPQAPVSHAPPPALARLREKMGRPPAAPAPTQPRPPSIPGRYVKINPKYYTVETSGLSFTVQRGEVVHDILLTSK